MDTEQAPQPKAELINVAKVTEPKQSERTDLKSAPDVGEKGNLVQHEGDLNMNKMGTNQPEQVPNQQPPQPLPQNKLKVVTEVPDVVPTRYVSESGFDKGLPSLLKKYGNPRPITVLEKEIGSAFNSKKTVLDEAKEINKIEQKELNAKDKETDKLKPDEIEGKITVTVDSKDNPLAQLQAAKSAYIDQYYRVSDLFICCPLHYRYHISLDFGKNQAYHLFDTKEFSPVCSHDCCPNQAREIDIEVDGYTVEEHKKQKFMKLHKPYRCACCCFCACCTRPTLIITNEKTNEQLGRIVEIGTACDPTMYLYYKKNRAATWKIVGSCCQCGYCCKSLCPGTCTEAEFGIYRPEDIKNQNMEGKIVKKRIDGEKLKPDVEQIEVTFPVDANPEEKSVFIAAGLLVGYLYYQNISNGKRCHNVEDI